jgi:hypothetical protein
MAVTSAALFLAAKVEDEPRKLEHIIQAMQVLDRQSPLHVASDSYKVNSMIRRKMLKNNITNQ